MATRLSNEDKRHICLDFVDEICKAGPDGISKLDLINKVTKLNEGRYFIDDYEPVFDKEYISAIGKNNAKKGERRWTRYIIDDQSIAEKLVNDYFDDRMTELDKWILYREIAKFVDSKEHKVASESEVIENFCIELSVLVEMNTQLTLLNVPLDYPEGSKNGKFKLSDHTLAVINNKIAELESEEAKKAANEKRKNLELARKAKKEGKGNPDRNGNLLPLDPKEKKKIQLKLVELIYEAGQPVTSRQLSASYQYKYGHAVRYNTVESFLKNIPGIGFKNDQYRVNDLNQALSYLNPLRSRVRFEVVVSSGVVIDYKNMAFSRSIGVYDIYILDDINSYDLYIQILELMLIGASIDSSITDKVKKAMIDNMKCGKKSIL